MAQYSGLVCLLAVALAASQESWRGPALPKSANSTPPVTETPPAACNNPWDGENWTSNSFKLYRKVCREEQLCFNRTRNTTIPVCYTLDILGFSYHVCRTKIEVVREPYCIRRNVCERQASVASVGQSKLRSDEGGIISHSNESDKSGQYENNTEQIWNIQATKPGQYIYLYIETLEIEHSTDCMKDYLLIQDSPCSHTHKLCGTMSGVSYSSTTGQLQIKFSSDSDTTSGGFRGVYWFGRSRQGRRIQRPRRNTGNNHTNRLRQLMRRLARISTQHK